MMLHVAAKAGKSVPAPAEVMAKLQIFEDLGRDLALYDREWTRIKTAQ